MVFFDSVDLYIRLIINVAYNKIAPPDPIPGFSGPVEFGGAINAPHGYMGYKWVDKFLLEI